MEIHLQTQQTDLLKIKIIPSLAEISLFSSELIQVSKLITLPFGIISLINLLLQAIPSIFLLARMMLTVIQFLFRAVIHQDLLITGGAAGNISGQQFQVMSVNIT